MRFGRAINCEQGTNHNRNYKGTEYKVEDATNGDGKANTTG